jgi:Transposase IS4
MTPRKSHRVRKARTIWEQRGAPSAAKDPKITKKTARTEEKTALKPVATGPLPKTVEFDVEHLPELPTYKPPLDLEFEASESLATGLTELETFQKLLTPAIIDIIVNATNSYATNARTNTPILSRPRSWKPVNSIDIYRYLGCLVHMGIHINRKYEEH